MLRGKNILAVLVLSLLVAASSTIYASGFPMVSIITAEGDSIIVVGKIDDSTFTFSEADELATTVNRLLGLVDSEDVTVSLLTPGFLQGVGFSDADAVKDLVLGSYRQEGFELYIFLEISKRTSLQTGLGTGQSLRIDAYVAGLAALFGSSENYLYVASIEAPEFFLALAGSLDLSSININLLVERIREQLSEGSGK